MAYTNSIYIPPTISIEDMQVDTSGGDVTINDGVRGLYYDPATIVAVATITMMANPVDGQEIIIPFGGTITSGTVITSVTFSPNTGQTIVYTPFSFGINAGDTLMCKYKYNTLQWYISLVTDGSNIPTLDEVLTVGNTSANYIQIVSGTNSNTIENNKTTISDASYGLRLDTNSLLFSQVGAAAQGVLSSAAMTASASWSWVLPDKSGTIATTGDIPSQATIRAYISGASGVSYNNTTGVASINEGYINQWTIVQRFNAGLNCNYASFIPAAPASGFELFTNASNDLAWKNPDTYTRSIKSTLTADRNYTLPNSSGTIALVSNIPVIVMGLYTTTAGALDTSFVFAHGLGYTPTHVNVTAKTAGAALPYYVTWDGTNITVTTLSAPGIVSVSYSWESIK